MPSKEYYPARWFFREWSGEWCMVKAGMYEPSIMLSDDEIEHRIRDNEIHLLLDALNEAGYIKPRLDQRLHDDDTKITHRLIDVIQGMVIRNEAIKS